MCRLVKHDLFWRSDPVLRLYIQSIFTRAVAEVRDEFSIGRPRWVAFGRTARICKVANVTFLRRNGEYLAAGLDQHALSGGRNFEIRHSIADVFPSRHHPRKIARDINVDDVFLARFWIELMNVTCLLENDGSGA